MPEKTCIFCNHDLIKDDILWESDNFFVKIGFGILGPGHVMIITKKHMSCFGELPEQFNKEFMLLKEEVFNKIKNNFSEPIVYEHGMYGQSVNHAHVHFVPNKSDFYKLENIGKKIFNDIKSEQTNDFFQIRSIFQKEGSYFYLEEKSNKYIFHTKGLPENEYTFRKEFARLTGLGGLKDWRNMDEEEKQRNKAWIKTTKEILRRDVKF